MTAPMETLADAPPLEPPKDLLFRHRLHLFASLRQVWRQREMVRSLAEREIRARYKQTTLSWGWALLTPLALMVVFTVFIRRVADVDTQGAPYALFAYLGLIPWTFFSSAFTLASNTMLNNQGLINKIYCPREMFPLSSVVIAAIDAAIAASALVAVFAITGYAPRGTSVWVPLIAVVQVSFVVGACMVVSISVVYARDLRNIVPLLLQIGLFATPVAYALDDVPERWHALYATLNPVAPVIDSYRRTVLFGQQPQWDLLGYGAAGSLVLLLVGYWYFKRLETGIADLA